MTSYPDYKLSELPGLKQIPAHWEMHRLKHLASVRFSGVDKHIEEGEVPVQLCNYTDVYYQDYITQDLAFMKATATLDEVSNFTLQEGDLIVTKDSESWDDIAVPAYVSGELENILCGYHLALIHPDPDRVYGEYLFRAFQATGINEQFQVAATGITRYGLGQYWLDNALFPVPPLPEQRAIAAFLDRKTAEIDALVQKQERLIVLLEERRAALISHTVTKGLDPDVPMRDSGIPWLGEIPAHWDAVPLKRLWEIIDCKHRTAEYVPNGIPIVSTTEVKPGRLNLNDTRMTTESDFQKLTKGNRLPKRGDIIYSRNASLGSAAYVDTDERFCMGQDVCLITSSKQNQLFLNYQLNSDVVLGQIEALSVGATFQRINIAQIRNYWIARPPLCEQHHIAVYLDRETTKIDDFIIKTHTAVDRLHEYRTALISAAVTGAIDVRGNPP